MATIVDAQAFVFFVVPSVHNGKQRLWKKKTEKETEESFESASTLDVKLPAKSGKSENQSSFGKKRTTGSTFSERKNSQSLNSDQFLYACSNALKQKIGCWVVDSTYGHVICVKYQFPKSVKTCYPAFSLISPLVFER